MSLVLKDRVRETTTVLGTNDATLLGAVTGFQAFSVVGNGNTCYYTISDQSGGNWEVGIGTYSTVGPTLARTTILASSNSGSIVSFPAGTKDVFLTLPAEVAVVSSNNPSTAGYVLSSNGTGVAPSWVAGTSITVGAAGSNTQVQYNNSGVLGASSNFTFDGTNIGLAGGTANGVAYLNGSKVLTTGSALTFDGSNLNINCSAAVPFRVQQSGSNDTGIEFQRISSTNAALFSYNRAGSAYTDFSLYGSNFVWLNSGTEQMRLTSTGLGIGTSSPASFAGAQTLTVNGSGSGVLNVQQNGTNAVRIAADATASYIYEPRNASLVFSTNSADRMRLDSSGNLGLGVTPSAWVSTTKALQIATFASFFDDENGATAGVGCNMYQSGVSTFNYKFTGQAATKYVQGGGQHQWYTAPSGTAGNAISFTQAMTLTSGGALQVGNAAANIIQMFHNQSVGYIETAGTSATPIGFATSGTERMRIDSSGNVGIGTSSPADKLEVAGSIRVSGSGSATADNAQFYNASGFGPTINGYNFAIRTGAGTTSERMRIDSSGNVGIGTSNPEAKLDVLRAGNTSGGTIMMSGGKTDGTNKYGNLTTTHYSNATYPQGVCCIAGYNVSGTNYVDVGGNVGEQLAASTIRFWTAANSTTAGGTERMRIDSSGNLLVGTTSAQLSGKLSVVGTSTLKDATTPLFVWNSGTSGTRTLIDFEVAGSATVGTITTDGTTTAYNTSSDYRLKENIQPMQNALGVVTQLNPVTYTWKADGSDGQGFIAHELQAVVPECVVGEKDAVDTDGNPVYQGIDTSFLVATLTKAIQELKAELDATKAEVAALKGN